MVRLEIDLFCHCPAIDRFSRPYGDFIFVSLSRMAIAITKEPSLFYRELVAVANYLQERDPDIEEILQMFCMREFAHLRFIAAFFFQFERDGRLHLRNYYGAEPATIGLDVDPLEMSTNLPVTNCIREGRLIWIASTPQIRSNGSARFKSVLAWPIYAEFRIIGSLLAISETQIQEDSEVQEFMSAFTNLVGTTLAKKISVTTGVVGSSDGAPERQKQELEHSESNGQLSERQELILKLIAEGRTNSDIADILGYSESLIRQETIRIYSSLGCNGRAQAGQMYRERAAARVLTEH